MSLARKPDGDDTTRAAIRAAIARAIPAPPPPPSSSPRSRRRGKAETGLTAAITAALRADARIGWAHRNIVRRTPFGWFGLGVGSPDIAGILMGCSSDRCSRSRGCGEHGRALFVEVKMADDRSPDRHQISWHETARLSGALVIVATSVEEALAGLP